ncbi:MAG: serine/threonine protein kinase [Planctomycetes bacterium]|nr:serine/threonine protein kinase [Planctomycetota bacterium]
MRTHAGPPDDTLREFLLGTLSADGADEVQRWLDSDPANAAWLAQLLARDPLTDAVNACSADAPVSADAVERVVRGVSDSRHPRVPVDADTPARDDRTVRRSLPTGGSAWPPERLGQFRILRELGHGGMGYVFEAEDEKLDRRVAVKVLAPELARRPVAATRFLREARAAAKVDHENVVPVLHVGEDRPAGSTADGTGREDGAGTPFMVMPLLRGESLSDRLKRCEPMSIAEALRVGRDVAAGLAAAHAMGLVHRDLKPGNV